MTKKIIYLSVIILTLTLIFVPPLFSSAQINLGGNTLEMSMSPENPEPGQTVKISLKSYSYDLNRLQITWYVDGVQKKTNIGLKDFNTVAGRNGQKTIIKAVVNTEEGIKEIEAFFIPSLVDLIYESLSYTPPFYKGRALNPNQGVVIVTAIPELMRASGEKVQAQNIIYSWKKDGKVQESDSGLGKNVFVFAGTVPIRDSQIEVVASTIDSDIYASKKVNITNVVPKIVFYENNPVYGIMFNRAIKNTVKMSADEFNVFAVPFFFSVGYATTPDLNYIWTLNGQEVSNQDPKNTFTTRIESAGSGLANIDLKISNTVRIFQFIDNSYKLSYQKE